MSDSNRRPLFIGGTLLVLVLGGVLVAYVLAPRLTRSDTAVPLIWVLPETRSLASTVTTSGSVRLKTGAVVRVGAQVSGTVRTLNVTVGSPIRAGDVIAEIDPRPLEARVAQAETEVAMDQIALDKARHDLTLSQRLLAAQLTARQQTEDLDWQVKAATAKLESSKSSLAATEVDLSYSVIRAPISGIVASVSTQKGETVAASFAAPTFVTIVDTLALELVAMVDETDIASVKPGEAVIFTVEASPSQELTATVTRVDPTATIISGVVNYPVVASLHAPARVLKPDMTANVSIRTAEYRAFAVPSSAVHGDGSDKFVYVIKDGVPVKQPVMVGAREAGFTEIRKGLGSTDRVVVNAFQTADKKD
jgi:HlyD family secretion protein